MIAKKRIGGQAVLEGVMMRGTAVWALAVRKPDGSISRETFPIDSAGERWPFLKKPFLRGFLALVESLAIGFKAITLSAELSIGAEEEELGRGEMAVAYSAAILLAVGLFVLLPLWLSRLAVPGGGQLFYWFEGLIRVAVFIIYILGISLMPDMRRVFQYHGAEHKAIHAYEEGLPLEPDAVLGESPLHVRCGTSFLLIVMVIAIIVFSIVGKLSWPWLIASRVIGIPLISGLSYEVIRFAGRHQDEQLIRFIMAPGLALQRLTTKAPDRGQVEVALAALRLVLDEDAAETDNLAMP